MSALRDIGAVRKELLRVIFNLKALVKNGLLIFRNFYKKIAPVLIQPDVFEALKVLEIIGLGEHGGVYWANISTILGLGKIYDVFMSGA
jgi:hypothetical protein